MSNWSCKIGDTVGALPMGSDELMRQAVANAYKQVTGEEPTFIFSGWGASLSEKERAVVENREPDEDTSLHQELTKLLNYYSKDAAADTPDFILATFLMDCLAAYQKARQEHGTWVGEDDVQDVH